MVSWERSTLQFYCTKPLAHTTLWQVTKQFEAPEESGRYPVTFVMYGPYTPTVRAKYDIVVADDDDHMRLSQL